MFALLLQTSFCNSSFIEAQLDVSPDSAVFEERIVSRQFVFSASLEIWLQRFSSFCLLAFAKWTLSMQDDFVSWSGILLQADVLKLDAAVFDVIALIQSSYFAVSSYLGTAKQAPLCKHL